jgi:hypothetical protein
MNRIVFHLSNLFRFHIFRAAFSLSSQALPPLSRLRPVDQPEPVRSVIWLDSAGHPAYGRGGGPGPRGTAQQPITSGVSCRLCK